MHVKITNGNPEIYTIGELRRDNPNTSFPRIIPDNILSLYGVYPYTNKDQPEYDQKTQKLESGNFIQDIDGKWLREWIIVEKTQEEIDNYAQILAADIRSRRNLLLAETDYLALSDNILTTEMASYRQALRDITSHPNFPHLLESDWPIKP